MNKRPVSGNRCVKLNVGNWVASRHAPFPSGDGSFHAALA
jgi:hypothetical protein